MRSRLSQFAQQLAIASAIAAMTLTGCSSASSFKMPSSSWFAWGKKKPADSTLASRKSDLPAPPSTTGTPHGVPSYASGSPSGPQGYANSPGGTPATYASQGAPATYPMTGYGSPSDAPAYGSVPAQPAAAQGGYGSQYPQSGYAAAGAGANCADGYCSTAPPATASTAPSGGYGQYGASGYSANPAPPATGSQYGTPPSGYGTQSASLAAPTGGYGDYGYNAAPANSPSTPPNYGTQQPDGSLATQAPATAGGYRPGSTGRTPVGTPESLRVADAAGIQPTSYSDNNTGTNSTGGYGAASGYGAPASSGYPATAPSTATGGSSTYNSTYRPY